MVHEYPEATVTDAVYRALRKRGCSKRNIRRLERGKWTPAQFVRRERERQRRAS